MTRWLEAEKRTNDAGTEPTEPVLSVLSVLSEVEKTNPAASVATPLTETARARMAALPTAPPTCAACGVADWHVSLTDAKRRTLHVACWRADERGKR